MMTKKRGKKTQVNQRLDKLFFDCLTLLSDCVVFFHSMCVILYTEHNTSTVL